MGLITRFQWSIAAGHVLHAGPAFLDHRPQDAFGRHRYDPADFGWTYADLEAEFKAYIERYGIEAAGTAWGSTGRVRSPLPDSRVAGYHTDRVFRAPGC